MLKISSREFVKIGYKVGLIAKNEKNLQAFADELKADGGEVSSYLKSLLWQTDLRL